MRFGAGGKKCRNLAWIRLFGQGLGSLRSSGFAMLVFAILTPYLSGFTQLLNSRACEMQCCKAAAGCHRSDHHHAPAGPHWTTAPSCPDGCGQRIGVTGSVSPTVIATRFEVTPTLRSSFLQQGLPRLRTRAGADFAQFERPPPTFLLTA
jgi:hypothetical protein